MIKSVFVNDKNRVYLNQQEYHAFLDKRMRIMALLLSLALGVLFAATHEYWTDEYQSWAIACDVPLLQLPSMLPTEGHPLFYYLYLKLFVQWLPATWMTWTSCILYFCAQIVLYRVDMMRTEVFALLSIMPTTAYWFGGFARSYVLCYLCIALLLYGYNSRFEYKILYSLLIAASLNVHYQFTVVVACFGCIYGIELIYLMVKEFKQVGLLAGLQSTKKHVIAGFIMLFGVLLSVAQFTMADTDVGAFEVSGESVANVVNVASKTILGYYGVPYTGVANLIGIALLFIFMLFIMSYALNLKTSGIAMMVTYIGNAAVLIKVNLTTSQKTLLLLLSMLLCCYISPVFEKVQEQQRSKHRYNCALLLCSCILLHTITSMDDIVIDVRYDFYGSKMAAEAMEQYCTDKSIPLFVAQYTCSSATSRMAEDGYTVMYAESPRGKRYAVWFSTEEIVEGEAVDALMTQRMRPDEFIDLFAHWYGIEDGTRMYVVFPLLYTGYSDAAIAEEDERTQADMVAQEVDNLQCMDAEYMRSIGLNALVDWDYTYGYYTFRGVVIDYVIGSSEGANANE